MEDLTGHSIGRYHILERLGAGGMAIVYKAYDTRLERDVAIKVLRTGLFGPDVLARVLKRFEREAKAVARLAHPNIVRVHDYGEHEGQPYLVMEYLPGGTLKQRLRQGRMDWDEAVRLVLPLAHALAYAHEHRVVHRDVKPSNILLTEKGQPMLTDFGIAKILDLEDGQTLTATGTGVGTPEYMAPEQGLGKPVDARADVYSLGVVLYEMVTGRKPYTADTPMAVVLKQMTEPLPRPTHYVPDLPEGVERVLLKALAKEPENRYADMTEFARALEGVLGERSAVGSQRSVFSSQQSAVRGQASAISSQRSVVGGQSSTPLDAEATRDALAPPGAPQPPTAAPGETPDTGARDTHPPSSVVRRLSPAVRRLSPWLLAGLGVALAAALIGLSMWLGGGGGTPLAFLATETPTPTATPTLGVGSTWTRPADGMVMMYVPAGPFKMGSTEGDSDEEPVHTVTLDAFWIDQTEVTNAMYVEFLNAIAADVRVEDDEHVYYAGNEIYDLICTECGSWEDRIRWDGSRFRALTEYAEHPAALVTWYGAQAYCEWAGARLPTEAEWEKAARGGLEGKKYPWGDEDPVCTPGAQNGAQYYDCDGRTVPVMTFAPNGYGLYDMAGNVWEWVADWYDSGYYDVSPSTNPQGPSSGEYRLLRGGSWPLNGYALRAANRHDVGPSDTLNIIGFRCARSP